MSLIDSYDDLVSLRARVDARLRQIDANLIRVAARIQEGEPGDAEGDGRFKRYRRTNISEMRPYESGEDLGAISVSRGDDPENDMGMIARNPDNHEDQWYVARAYFKKNFEPAEEPTP